MQETIEDGPLLPFCGGRVIFIPGQPLYEEKKPLITADALVKTDGALHRSCWRGDIGYGSGFTIFGKFSDYDISPVVCYHGGVFQGSLHQRI
ncbi:hypothetical protein [Bacillus atrophaeus]|uniref:hypothetical protein n=1 Tax=Bacillus atrophaeus TaxID=1452 RepID=UPI001EFBC014|nr:hypothetical protein [Bacillus atrophaeus]